MAMSWESVRHQLLEIYSAGKQYRGHRAYSPLLLFKMLWCAKGTTYRIGRLNYMYGGRFMLGIIVG